MRSVKNVMFYMNVEFDVLFLLIKWCVDCYEFFFVGYVCLVFVGLKWGCIDDGISGRGVIWILEFFGVLKRLIIFWEWGVEVVGYGGGEDIGEFFGV